MSNPYDWTGQWFTPTIYRHYYVPENAANYNDLRGKEGVCMGSFQTGFGHVWALIKFDDGTVKRVRTSYLLPVNDGSNQEDKLLDGVKASMTPTEKAQYALTEAGNHGTIVNYDRRDL